MKDRIPNLIELGRRPNPLRYVWILVNQGVHAGATWMGLMRSSQKHPKAKLLVLDLQTKQVIPAEPNKFLDNWRCYYFDPKWDYQREKGS